MHISSNKGIRQETLIDIKEAIRERHSVRQYSSDHIMGDVRTNIEALIQECNKESGLHTQLFMLLAIALLIVMATSVILIYNAFGMSLTEKIKYLGMLASVGATRLQKRASIYFEGLVLGLIGIPLRIGFSEYMDENHTGQDFIRCHESICANLGAIDRLTKSDITLRNKERTWCTFCPMGTMTQSICKIKEKGVNK